MMGKNKDQFLNFYFYGYVMNMLKLHEKWFTDNKLLINNTA